MFLPAWILGTGVPSGGDPEAGVQPGVWRNSIPKYFSQTLYIVSLRRALVGWSSLNSSIFRNMEGSPYRKLSFSRGKGAVPGTRPEVLHSGEPGYLLAGIQRPVSRLGSGGIQYPSIFLQHFAPYCSISSSNSGNNLCTQVNRSCSFSEGFP